MKKTVEHPPFPVDDEVSALADWAELSVIKRRRPLRRGTLGTTLTREDFGSSAADVWDELQRRDVLMGKRWPVAVDDSELTPRKGVASNPLYPFCLALALRQNITGEGRELFEHCVTELSAGLGNHPGMRLGFPRRAPIATSLADAVDQYCQASVEQAGQMKAPPLTDGDLGLDVVTWLAFRDGRGAYLHFIGQCATGADWKDKLLELHTHKWGDHINWAVPPVRFVAIPFVVGVTEFRRASLDGGLLLDRPRLLELSAKVQLRALTQKRVDRYWRKLYD